tara:strand:+ start:2262 stop:2852 length:591 start_codon:yes stop_codon:yes gene_type:complete
MMAQSSTTILASKSHRADISGTVINFTQTGTDYKISSSDTGSVNLSALKKFDLITITGTTNNNKTFTIKSVSASGDFVMVEEAVITETADISTTVTIDTTGFVSDKFKGDGYYSHPDGVHTVAYKVDATLTGSIKMQGSLATTPTEDDWFDISGSTFTTDQSTTISSANFTGNFVWIRAKATSITAGSITQILFNS